MANDEERYGTIKPIKRGKKKGAIADAAFGLRRVLNKAGGAGNMLMGQGPEEMDRWAHGFSPFKDRSVPGYAGLRGIPQLQEKRIAPVVDALTTLVPAQLGLRKVVKTGVDAGVDAVRNPVGNGLRRLAGKPKAPPRPTAAQTKAAYMQREKERYLRQSAAIRAKHFK